MGWYGLFRSIAAEERRQQREHARMQRLLARGRQRSRRRRAAISAEIERDLTKIRKFEERLVKRPVEISKVDYTPREGWTTEPYRDETGAVHFTVPIPIEAMGVVFQPAAMDLEDTRLRPMAVAANAYATFVCFSATTDRSANLDLVNRSHPGKSRIALVGGDGVPYWPVDDTLDCRLASRCAHEGIVAFEPFAEAVASFELVVHPRPSRRDEDLEPVRIQVSGADILQATAKAVDSTTLVEQVEEHLEEEASARQGAIAARKHARGVTAIGRYVSQPRGCFGILMGLW